MEQFRYLRRQILYMGITTITWVAALTYLSYALNHRAILALMLIGVAVISFYGFLSFPGNIDDNGSFKEARIRLAIAGTLLMVYLVYFGSTVYLTKDQTTAGEMIDTFDKELLPTLTNLLMVVIPFYFGSAAAVEIANIHTNNREKQNRDDEV